MAKSKKGKSGGKSKGAKKEKAPKASKKDKKDKGSKKDKKGGGKKDMEVAKLRAEKEEQERLKKEAEEKALAEKKLAIEMAERPGHLIDSLKVIQTYDKWVIGKLDRHKKQREWKSFKVCRNIPDFTKLYEVNSYMAFWLSQLDPPGMKKLLKLSPEVLQLVSELHTFLELPPDCMSLDLTRELGLVYRDIVDYQKTYLDKCTYSILEDLSTLYDPEMGICDYLLSIPEITHCLWGNIFQCPDINEHEFEELKFKFKIPEALLTAAGIYRLVKTEYDHYSDSCLSYFPPGVENALKQSIIDWMELHKMTGGEYYDLPSPVEEKPSKTKGKGKGKGKKGSKKKGKKGSKGKKKGKKKGDDSDLSDLDDDMKFLLEDEDDGGKKKKGKKKGKEKKGKKGKKGKGGGGTTTEESGVSTTEGEETTAGEEEGGTTTGGEEEGDIDHETEKKIAATKIPTDAELLASTKETKEERRARRRREAEQADDDEDNFDGGVKEVAVDEEENTATGAADKKGKKAKDTDKDKGEETGDDEDSKKAKGGKKGDAKSKVLKPKKDSSGGDDEAGPTGHSDYDDDDGDTDTKPAATVAEEKAENQEAPEEKKMSDGGGGVEEDASGIHKAKKAKSKKSGNVKKSKSKSKSGKKSKKEKEAERKEEVREALNDARGRIKKEGKIKTQAGEGKKSKKGKKGKKKAKGSEETVSGKSKKGKGDKKGKSKSKEKGKAKGSSDSKGKPKEKDKKAKSPAKAKAKPKPKPAKSKSKSPGGSKAKPKKDKGGSKPKKDKKKDKGSKSKGKDKKDKSRSKSKKKGKKGKKGDKSKSKERHKTEAELAKERERAEKAKFIPQLHEHELNLRNYTILGGVFDFNLYCIPSQPKIRTKWTVHLRETNSTLKELAFEADYTPPIPPDQDSAKKTPEEMEKEAKHQEEELTKLLMPEIPKLPPTQAEIEEEEERQKELFAQMVAEYEAEKEKRLALLVLVEIESPRVALWFEPPTPVRWDPQRKVWSTEGFYDIRFNENNLQLSFRTVRFGTLAFGHNRWSNLPYQSWEIRPLGKDKVSFSLTAAIAVIEFVVFGDLICVIAIQNVTNSQEVEAALLNKYMKPHNLIKTMRYHGLDIFPEIDSYAYVDGVLVKHFESEDHLYQCMAIACSAFNFQWSRWNLLAGREKMIYQMRERHGTATPGNYSMVLTTPRNTLRINCTEVSPTYTEEPVDTEYNADLLNLVKATATDQGLKVMNESNPHHIEALRVLLASVRPLSFS